MKFYRTAGILLLGSLITTSAIAETAIYPMQLGDETLRYLQGTPTLELESANGAVEVTPLPFDHGSVSFRIAVYNKGVQSSNIDGSNLRVQVGAQELAAFTKDELVHKAKNRAGWAKFGTLMVAGLAAGLASQAYTTNTYVGHYSSPFGSSTSVISWRDNTVGVLGASAATAAGVAGIVGIQNRLDYTLRALSNEVMQTTTVDPNSTYAARVVFEKIKNAALPQDVRLTVRWNGEVYPFAFRLAKPGHDLPPAYTHVAASPLPAAQAVIAPAVAPAAPIAVPTLIPASAAAKPS
jgi:hypothetical protein